MSDKSRLQVLNDARAERKADCAARQRLLKLFDENSFVELDAYAKTANGNAGVVTGYGLVEGSTVFAFSQDIADENGAVGKMHAAKVRRLYDLAAKMGAPIVGIYDSNGGKIREGNDTLAAYGEIIAMGNRLSGVVPQISVVAGVCAGSAAMACLSADFVVMEKDAQLFMTAPFTAKANGEQVENAGGAENAAASGTVHLLAEDDTDAMEKVRELVSLMPLNNLSTVPMFEFSENETAGEVLRQACENMADADKKTIVDAILDQDSAVEIQAQFAPSVYAGLATLGGSTVGFAAAFEKLDADCCAKLARLMSICDAFQIPVLTFVNTSGFVPSAKAELTGSIREAAKLAHVYAEATTPKVSVVLGNAIGAAYIALAGTGSGSDLTLAWPGAVISALEPETAAAFLYADRLNAGEARKDVVDSYKENDASAFRAAADGYIQDVIDPAETRDVLISTLDMLAGKRDVKLPKKHSNMPL